MITVVIRFIPLAEDPLVFPILTSSSIAVCVPSATKTRRPIVQKAQVDPVTYARQIMKMDIQPVLDIRNQIASRMGKSMVHLNWTLRPVMRLGILRLYVP